MRGRGAEARRRGCSAACERGVFVYVPHVFGPLARCPLVMLAVKLRRDYTPGSAALSAASTPSCGDVPVLLIAN